MSLPATHPVIALILQRVAERSLPLRRADPHHLALAVEGGGMRGVLSAGMLLGLADLGLLHTVDSVYGASAGAANAAYLLGGADRSSPSVYYTHLANRRFIDLARPLRGRPVFDLDFLTEEVLLHVKPPDHGALAASPIPLHIIAYSLTDARERAFSAFPSLRDVLRALRASIHVPLPWLSGPPVTIDGEALVDASIWEGVPRDAARRAGATHVLVAATRAAGTPARLPWLDPLIAHLVSLNVRDSVARARVRRGYLAPRPRPEPGGGDSLSAPAEPHVYAVRPPGHLARLSAVERRPEVLVAAMAAAMREAIRPFGLAERVGTDQLAASILANTPVLPRLSTA